MRILEIVLLLLVTILPFIKRSILKRFSRTLLLSFLLVILSSHLVIEGWRWQMTPIYFLIIVLVWRISLVKEFRLPKLTFIRGVGYMFLILVILPSWILPNVFPVFSLPTPTGAYQVGTHLIHLKTNMDEPITTDIKDKRELMIKVWYPAKNNPTTPQEPYLDKTNRDSFIHKYGGGILSTSSMNYLDKVKTHVYQNAPIVEDSFPVLIFSHGYGSNASGYYALLTEIASHGYIIINMNHTYESLGSFFPDGREAYFDYEFQAIENKDAMEHITPITDAFKNNLPYDQRHAIIREASKNYNVTHMVKRWTKDMMYTIDQLEDWNTNGFLKNRMDLDKIGVFGHSRGGGAAGQVALKDHRIKAAANIDGIQWGEMMDTIYHQPFLYISADWPAEHQDINAHVYKHKSTDYFYESKIQTTAHPNFMDIPFMIPIKGLAQTGDIDPELGIKITNDLILSFFNKHIKNDKNAEPEKIATTHELVNMTVYKNGVRINNTD